MGREEQGGQLSMKESEKVAARLSLQVSCQIESFRLRSVCVNGASKAASLSSAPPVGIIKISGKISGGSISGDLWPDIQGIESAPPLTHFWAGLIFGASRRNRPGQINSSGLPSV